MSWSVCIPDSCGVKDVLNHFSKIVKEVTEGLDINVTLKEENCVSIIDEPQITTLQLVIL